MSIGWRDKPENIRFFNGLIDEIAIYNSPLAAASITQHYSFGLQNKGYCQVALDKISLSSPDIFSSIGNNVNGNQVQLNWETVSDLRDGKFEVERAASSSNSIKDWQKVGEVDLSMPNDSKSFMYTDNPNCKQVNSYTGLSMQKTEYEIYSEQIEARSTSCWNYVLYQNYPNPFNPSTKIRFAVPLNTKVTIEIYNQLGELVAQPVNTIHEAGSYDIEVNMGNYASGVYFYRISAGTFSDVKKMMLTK